jgi:hypothetical protein
MMRSEDIGLVVVVVVAGLLLLGLILLRMFGLG